MSCKIVFVTNLVTPYRKTFYEKLSRSLNGRLILVSGTSNKEDGRPDYKGKIEVAREFVVNHEFTLGSLKVRWQSGLLSKLVKLSPSVIVLLGMSGTITNWLALCWAKLNRRPVIIWACGWEPPGKGRLARWLKYVIARIYFSAADKCLVYSTKGKHYLENLGVLQDRLTICYNGIETDSLVSREELVQLEASQLRLAEAGGSDIVFLYVGGMLTEKRVDMLIQAFSSLERSGLGCMLWLVGDGPDRDQFEKLVEQLAIRRARFFGRVIDGVDKFFAAADFFVLPGIGGLAFNQAMFWGTPCIGSLADGTEDDLVLDDYTGKRFVAGSVESLREAMLACIRMPRETRSAMAERGRELILDRSNVNTMVLTFNEAIQSLASIRG